MSDVDNARSAVPPDWREKLIAVLSADGITQPPHVPGWRRFVTLYGKSLGWILFVALCTLIGLLIVLIPLSIFLPSWEVDIYADAYATKTAFVGGLIGCWFAYPRIRRALHEATQIRLGYQPTRVLQKAKHPPVLFLRSFKFDALSSALPWWQARMPINANLPTPELNLAQMISRHAPVLAIGKPNEFAPPFGAVRFYVRRDIWQRTIEAIVPLCQFVVWTSGHTEGLRWEIQHLRDTLPPRKLLIWVHANIGKQGKTQRDAEWSKFREAFGDVFPKPLPADAASTRFIAFEDDWTPIAIPGPGYRPTLWELIASWPKTYGLEPLSRKRLEA